MNPQRNRLAHWGSIMVLQHALLIESVPHFMQRSIQRNREIIFLITRGQALVHRTQLRAKRMSGGVDTARFKIKSESLGNFLIELALSFDGVNPEKGILWNRLTSFSGFPGKWSHGFGQAVQDRT